MCVRASVCFKLLFVLCKTFFDLGDSGCEFDARQLWLETFFLVYRRSLMFGDHISCNSGLFYV